MVKRVLPVIEFLKTLDHNRCVVVDGNNITVRPHTAEEADSEEWVQGIIKPEQWGEVLQQIPEGTISVTDYYVYGHYSAAAGKQDKNRPVEWVVNAPAGFRSAIAHFSAIVLKKEQIEGLNLIAELRAVAEAKAKGNADHFYYNVRNSQVSTNRINWFKEKGLIFPQYGESNLKLTDLGMERVLEYRRLAGLPALSAYADEYLRNQYALGVLAKERAALDLIRVIGDYAHDDDVLNIDLYRNVDPRYVVNVGIKRSSGEVSVSFPEEYRPVDLLKRYLVVVEELRLWRESLGYDLEQVDVVYKRAKIGESDWDSYHETRRAFEAAELAKAEESSK